MKLFPPKKTLIKLNLAKWFLENKEFVAEEFF
jgi:hypothetical protein